MLENIQTQGELFVVLSRIECFLKRIEERLVSSLEKDFYTSKEAAERLNRSPYTIRQWCNKGVVHAKKIRGRGDAGEWRIPHEELLRLQRDGSRLIQTAV